MTQVLALIPREAEEGDRLRDILEGSAPEEGLEVLTDVGAFVQRLREPLANVELVVLVAPTSGHVHAWSSLADMLDGLRVVLVVGEAEATALGEAHRLHPRVVVSGADGMEQLPAILERMIQKRASMR